MEVLLERLNLKNGTYSREAAKNAKKFKE